jgi:hydroxyacylglutathione hydrolase
LIHFGRQIAVAAPANPHAFGRVNLRVIPAGPIQTNAYLLTAPDHGAAILVDAPQGIWEDIEPILREQKCALRELWLTHGHWDHTQGGAEIVRMSGAKVRAHLDDRVMIEQPDVMERFMGERMNLEPIHVDTWIKQGGEFDALGTRVEVRHVPGHCPGNVLFYFPKYSFAIVGDALFNGSVGRTDLPGGSFEQLEKSIREQIYTLPDTTVIFPGHGPKTTVGDEKAANPCVRG